MGASFLCVQEISFRKVPDEMVYGLGEWVTEQVPVLGHENFVGR